MIHNLNSRQHRNYRTIPVETLNDTRLSSQSYRLLMFLLAQDDSYKIDYAELGAIFSVHRDRVRVWMNELIKYEYVERECHTDPYEGGKFFWTFQVYAIPRRNYLHEMKAHLDRLHQERLEKNAAKITDINTVRRELWGS